MDEAGEVDKVGNYHQLAVRVSQTGGRIALATTRVRGHWMDEIFKRAETSEHSVELSEFDLFASPWMTRAAILQLFLNFRTLSERQLQDVVLPADDYREACLSIVRDPASLREHFGIETQGGRMLWSNWNEGLIYSSASKRHPKLVVNRDGRVVELRNITREVMARKWPRQTSDGKTYTAWAGVDFNVRGHAVVCELFGEGETIEAAIANEARWHVLVSDEVFVSGTTAKLAAELRNVGGELAVWHDPHGAAGHTARGTGNTSDAAELRNAGHAATPASGTDKQGRAHQLSELDSRNVIHRLHAEGRLLIHDRCAGLLDAMRNDLAKPDGRIDKRSGVTSETDNRSGYSDAMRYAIWPVFKSLALTTIAKR
jgi:hypothetical protein